MPKHPCSVEVNLNLEITTYLLLGLDLDKNIFEAVRDSLLREKCSRVSQSEAEVESPHPLGFVVMNFLTNSNPPNELAKYFTSQGQAFSGCILTILHRNVYCNYDTLTLAANGEAKTVETDPYIWALDYRRVDWEGEWIFPSLENRKDPLDPQRREEFESFCEKRGIRLWFWSIDDWGNMILCQIRDNKEWYQEFAHDPSRILDSYTSDSCWSGW